MALSDEQRAFLDRAVAAAAKVTPSTLPAYGPVVVAQAILESNWGRAAIGGFNVFGIKARAGEPSVLVTTTEYIKGVATKVKAAFKKFASLEEAFTDHRQLLTGRRYASSGQLIYSKALAHPRDPEAFAHALTGVYATDPKYGQKLVDVMKAYSLPQRFGFSASPTVTPASPAVVSPAAPAAAPASSPRWVLPVVLLLLAAVGVGTVRGW